MKIVGLAAGRKNGNSELLMKHAMLTMREQLDLEFTIIRLSDLDIEHCSGCESCMKTLISGGDGCCVKKQDDLSWLLEELKDADGLIVAAPIYDLLPSGNLITLLNRALGVGKEYREMCRAQKKVCAAIAVGGSDWIDFTEPIMNLVLTNLSKDAIVIDRLVIGSYTAPAMVLLDDDLLSRAAQLGSNMVNALLNKQNAQYQGPKGVCPGCHCNVIVPQNGLDVTCAFCKSRGKISIKNDALVIDWDKQSVETHRFTKQGEVDHQADIASAHRRAFEGKDKIRERKEKYLAFEPVVKP